MINAIAKSFLAIEQKASTPPLKMRKGCLTIWKAWKWKEKGSRKSIGY